jgi:hypothetical protein
MEKCSSILVVVKEAATSDELLRKAGSLAHRFGARLDVLVAEPAATCALARQCEAIGLDDRLAYFLHGSKESLEDVIVRHLESRPADLVMKSAAGPDALRRVLRAADDLALAARLSAPLMRVTEKPWRREMRLAAAIDGSERDGDAVARSILHAAGLIAMRCEATVDVLYSERETRDERLRMERAVRVARLVREFRVGGERLRILTGAPGKTLPNAVAAGEFDIVVIGAIPRSPSAWSPSPTILLANAATVDVMLVRETARATAALASWAEEATAARRAHP